MNLKNFFEQHKNNKIALGFSGGVDSSYLLYAGHNYKANIKAYYIKTQFQPIFELKDAKKIAEYIGTEITIINYDIMQHNDITENSKERCYFCKNKIFSIIKEQAAKDGCNLVIDGTNATDDINDRPGVKALCELSVKSPLRLCGLTKDDIRKLSKEAGLFTWNKAAYACLATRIPENVEITEEKLNKIEIAENILFNAGFKDFRVRYYHKAAKLQFNKNEIEKAFDMRSEIFDSLNIYFDDILLDLKER